MPTSKVNAITVDVSGFTKFNRALRTADKDMQKLLTKQIKSQVTGAVVPAARANASFSTKIPGTIKVSSTIKGVSVKAGGPKAPAAAAFEHGGQPGVFRHPTFGDREVWSNQTAHPFLTPAIKSNESALVDSVTKAFDAWAEEAGFR